MLLVVYNCFKWSLITVLCSLYHPCMNPSLTIALYLFFFIFIEQIWWALLIVHLPKMPSQYTNNINNNNNSTEHFHTWFMSLYFVMQLLGSFGELLSIAIISFSKFLHVLVYFFFYSNWIGYAAEITREYIFYALADNIIMYIQTKHNSKENGSLLFDREYKAAIHKFPYVKESR